jgi:hypothetical protein
MKLSVPGLLAVSALSFMLGTLAPTSQMQSSTAAQSQSGAQPGAQAQPSVPRYLLIDYMKVPSGGDAAYVQVEQDWKLVHQERIRAGKIAWWALYRATMPTGTSREYDYFTLTAYNRFQDIENSFTEEIFTKALQGKDINEIMTRTGTARSVVRDEVMVLVDQVGQPQGANR